MDRREMERIARTASAASGIIPKEWILKFLEQELGVDEEERTGRGCPGGLILDYLEEEDVKARDGSALRCSVALDDHDGLVGVGMVSLPSGTKIPVPLCEAHGFVPPEKPEPKKALYEHLKKALLKHVSALGPIPPLPSDPNEGNRYTPRETAWRAWLHETVLDLVDTVDEVRAEEEERPVIGQQFCADCGEPIDRDVQACAATFGWCRPQGDG